MTFERGLLSISRDNDWSGWCEFFLRAIMVQAQQNQKKASEILTLYETKKSQVIDLTHSQYAIPALDYIFIHPVFKASDFTNSKEIPAPTAKRILSIFRENEILKKLREANGRRPAVYIFGELVNSAEGKDIII